MCNDSQYCPQLIGFGTTAYHIPGFISAIIHPEHFVGGDPCRMWFDQRAGLAAGGYRC
jgi:hypothetical protein